MPKRFCACTGCPSCDPTRTRATHGALFDLDATQALTCPVCHPHARRRRNNPPGRASAAERGYGNAWRVLSRQVTEGKTHCGECGREFTKDNPATADHIIPRAQGGADELANLRCVCRSCNSRRGAGTRRKPVQ